MTQVFKHPAGEQLLADLRIIFEEKRIFILEIPFIVFVCGRGLDQGEDSLRKKFLAWAQDHLPEFICVLPEVALEDNFAGEGRAFTNLAEFETVVADVSDCVLIFAESAGAFAEIGYFSSSEKIRKKTLVANLLKYQAEESFLNKGPIDSISMVSILKPTVFIEDDTSPDFTAIGVRLKERIKRPSYRERIRYKKFGQFGVKQKLLIIFQILKLLQLADLATLRYVIVKCFGGRLPENELRHLVRILLAAKFIERDEIEAEYFRPVDEHSLIEIEHTEIERVRAQFQFFYQRHFADLYNVLAGSNQ